MSAAADHGTRADPLAKLSERHAYRFISAADCIDHVLRESDCDIECAVCRQPCLFVVDNVSYVLDNVTSTSNRRLDVTRMNFFQYRNCRDEIRPVRLYYNFNVWRYAMLMLDENGDRSILEFSAANVYQPGVPAA